MRGEFYTERDIVDLVRSGVYELHVGDEDRITDLARDRAAKEGLQILGPYKIPEQAAREAAATRYLAAKPEDRHAQEPSRAPERQDLRARVRKAVIAKLGNSIDEALLDDVIERVFQKLGR